MPKTRELLYLSFLEEENKVLSYGIEFNEFMNCIEDDIEEFIAEEVYNYGDFCWIDFDRLLEDEEKGSFEVSMYGLGTMTDMDAMYEDYEKYKAKANHNKSLEYIDNTWFLRDWTND